MYFQNPAIIALLEKYKTIWALGYMYGLSGWDMETYMPPSASEARGDAHGQLDVLVKKQYLDPEFISLLTQAANTKCNDYEKSIVRELQRSIAEYTALPDAWLLEWAQVTSEGTTIRRQAREENNFALFAPYLKKIFSLLRQKVDIIGYKEHPYDTLLNDYERGLKTSTAQSFFDSLKNPIKNIFARVKPEFLSAKPLSTYPYDKKQLELANMNVLEHLGFDTTTTRLDETTHPFCSSYHTKDVRIATRFESMWVEAIYSSLHEYGHAMYQLQYDPLFDKTPLANLHSMTIHESQSRFRENIIGRSYTFVQHFQSEYTKLGPDFAYHTTDEYYYAINTVRPDYIRTQADELTYHMHVLIRFEIERALIEGTLEVDALPAYWNAKYEEYLGITPPTDSVGVLQDVHWSLGLVGYFPTYSMGTALSAQRAEKMEADLGDLATLMTTSDGIIAMRKWLQDTVHAYGSTYTLPELLEKNHMTLSPDALLRYLEKKYT